MPPYNRMTPTRRIVAEEIGRMLGAVHDIGLSRTAKATILSNLTVQLIETFGVDPKRFRDIIDEAARRGNSRANTLDES